MNLNKLKSVVSDKKIVAILVVSFIFLAATFYVYIYYIKPRLNPTFIENREFIDKKDENPNKAQLYFFYANWCPHSKKALPVLKEFEKENTQYENVLIDYFFVNEEDNVEELASFEEKYNKKIDGFPTVLLIYKKQVIEFDSTMTIKNLNEFF